jgi:hypothetical protein
MSLWLVIGGVGLVLGGLVFIIIRSGKEPEVHVKKPGPFNRDTDAVGIGRESFAAYQIQLCTSPCVAARKIKEKRFTHNDLPELPLGDCGQSCNCSFKKLTDRRTTSDRRAPSIDTEGLLVLGEDYDDRRTPPDRRRRRR